MGQPDGQKHMGGMQGSGSTGRSAGGTDTFHIQHDQQGFSLDKLKAEVHVIGEPQGGMPVQAAVGNFFPDSGDHVISHAALFRGPFLHGGGGPLGSFSKSHDARHILCSRPALSFLGSAVDKGADLDAAADIQTTAAFGAVDFMGAGTQHIDAALLHIDGQLAEGLHRVGVKQNTVLPGNHADFLIGHHGTDLIVGRHDGNQNRLRGDGPLQIFQPDDTVLVHIQISNPGPLLLQPLAGMQHRVVLHL